MKRFAATLLATIAVLTLSNVAFADDSSMAGGSMMSGSHMMTHGKQVTLTGNVVDLSCYVGSGLHGSGHAACAKACLLKGQPFGIQTSDGNIVTFLGSGPNDNPNAKVLPFIERKVTVTGMEFIGHGVTGIRIDTIAAAK
jgi:hypothetical protein